MLMQQTFSSINNRAHSAMHAAMHTSSTVAGCSECVRYLRCMQTLPGHTCGRSSDELRRQWVLLLVTTNTSASGVFILLLEEQHASCVMFMRGTETAPHVAV
jgi:hypothetical protein